MLTTWSRFGRRQLSLVNNTQRKEQLLLNRSQILSSSSSLIYNPLTINRFFSHSSRISGDGGNFEINFSGGSIRKPGEWILPTIYTDEQGETHFGERSVKLDPNGEIGNLSDLIKLKGAKLRSTHEAYDYDWHCAPAKQLIINLNASVDVEVSSGEKRTFGAGEIFIVEDVTGKGHKSKAVDGVRFSVFLPFDE